MVSSLEKMKNKNDVKSPGNVLESIKMAVLEQGDRLF